MNVKNSGFTLIELMVAMVVGLTAITSAYTLGAAMNRQFYEAQRTATSQGTSRMAIMELRRDVSRAGLFGSPNAQLETRCEAALPQLPLLSGGNGPMGAFQYYADVDQAVVDPGNLNGVTNNVLGDRLRVLANLYLTDQLLVDSVSPDGRTIILDSGNQAYRRTFAWGQAAGPYIAGGAAQYLEGVLDWNAAWGGETAHWQGIAQKGARAFQTGSVLHIETPAGRHFFRTAFGKGGNVANEVRVQINGATPLPVGTACLPGAGENSTISPLQWVEYALVNPFAYDDDTGDPAQYMNFAGVFFTDRSPNLPGGSVGAVTVNDILDSPNVVLVRRILNPITQAVMPRTTQVVAEFVTNFQVSFLLDDNSGTTIAPDISTAPITGSGAETAINTTPNRVRTVIIDLGIRSPLEDPSLPFATETGAGTRFEVDATQDGSARVRHMRIEIPVMNVARRNL
jgi:prepilin-type N-terminal cleavage/methylation domain-containing protein